MRKRHFRFQSYGIPEHLTLLQQWAGWRDGFPLPFNLGWDGSTGYALPADPASWTDFRTALDWYPILEMDGIAFITTPQDPFFLITLAGAVQHRRLTPSARAVVRECCTYAEIAPNEQDVTLIVSFEDEVAAVIGGCALPPEFLPDDCPVYQYDGEVASWPATFHIPLSGMFIGSYNRIRLLPEPSTRHKETR